MYEISISFELADMKAITRRTLYGPAGIFMAAGAAAAIIGALVAGAAGWCLMAGGAFFLLYPPICCMHFPRKMLQDHIKIAPEAKYTFDAERILCISGAAIWTWGWDEVRRTVWTEDHMVILLRGGEALALPRSAMAACQGLEAFLQKQCG